MTAMSLGRTETALDAFYRRLAYRVGKANAITATARKPAILVYRTLNDGLVSTIRGPPPTTPSTASASFGEGDMKPLLRRQAPPNPRRHPLTPGCARV